VVRRPDQAAGPGHELGRIALDETTLKLREAKLGPDHPDTLNSHSSLAVDYDDAGQFTKSEPLFRQGMEQARK
jgi:hypothetical protein